MKRLMTIIFATIITSCCGQTINNYQNSMTVTSIDTLKQINDLTVTLNVLNNSQINLSVCNNSKSVINAYSYVKAEEKQYDNFEIEALTPDHDEMVFKFYTDRGKSAPIIEELKPGESFSHTIDLLYWAENFNKETLKNAGFNYLPHGIKIRAKYLNNPCENCNEYYKSIWTGYIYSDWVDF